MPTEKEREIGEFISRELKGRNLNSEYVGRIIYGYLGFENSNPGFRDHAPETGALYVQLVLNGFMYSTDGNTARVLEKRKSLSRLATLLFAIGVEREHFLIKTISEYDHDFVYPPEKGICFSALRLVHDDLEIIERESISNQELVDRIQIYFVNLRSAHGDGETPVKVLEHLLKRVPELSGYRIHFKKI